MSTYHLNSGDHAMIRGSIYDCSGKGPGGKYHFIAQKNRSSLYLSPEEIYDFYDQGKFRKLEPGDTNISTTSTNDDSYKYDLSSESATVRLEVLQRKFYMEAIREYIKEGGKLSEAPLKEFLDGTFKKLCKKLKTDGDKVPVKPISCSSAKRWYKKWHDSGYELISLVRERRGNSKPRLDLEVREVMENIIENRYLSKLRISAKKTYKEIRNAIKILNKDRARQNLIVLKRPSYETVLKHISRIDEYEKLAARYGHEYASKMTRPYGITPKINRALERVQMDHTQLDVYVDMGDKYLIRPHLTLAIDAYSKAIIGYWITGEPPSAESVMNCLNIAILKKDIVSLGGEKKWDYPMHGIPTELTLDNGKDFHSKDLEIACSQLGITMNYTPPRKPYYKSQVERKFGEINTSLLISLPGRVYKKEPEKRDNNYPHLTFDALNRLLLQWITTILHCSYPRNSDTLTVRFFFKIIGTHIPNS